MWFIWRDERAGPPLVPYFATTLSAINAVWRPVQTTGVTGTGKSTVPPPSAPRWCGETKVQPLGGGGWP